MLAAALALHACHCASLKAPGGAAANPKRWASVGSAGAKTRTRTRFAPQEHEAAPGAFTREHTSQHHLSAEEEEEDFACGW